MGSLYDKMLRNIDEKESFELFDQLRTRLILLIMQSDRAGPFILCLNDHYCLLSCSLTLYILVMQICSKDLIL